MQIGNCRREMGSYSLAGIDAALRLERAVLASPGGYALTGQSINLVYTQLAKVVVAGVGGFALAGQGVGLRKTSFLPVSAGGHAVTGTPATSADGAEDRRRHGRIRRGRTKRIPA